MSYLDLITLFSPIKMCLYPNLTKKIFWLNNKENFRY
jgi:hypothetical protein